LIDEPLTREYILRRLAEDLEDDTLRRIFPKEPPVAIRALLGAGPDAKHKAEPIAPAPQKMQIPPTLSGRCRLFTDGASRGNPGQAGAGAVLFDGQGEELAVCSAYLGICTNNVAEYRALLLGLDEALRQGCTELAIALDSELIVRQIQGRYKVKNEALLPLFQQVRERLNRIKAWSIAHVPRAQNARADQLANQGIDRKND
jgi:ribonuclease HI